MNLDEFLTRAKTKRGREEENKARLNHPLLKLADLWINNMIGSILGCVLRLPQQNGTLVSGVVWDVTAYGVTVDRPPGHTAHF